MNLTQAEKDTLRAEGYGPGRQHFSLCAVCGNARWEVTHTKEPDDIVASIANRDCERCNEVRARAPELFVWVLSVLAFKNRQTADT